MVYGKTIELFLVNGTADSLVTGKPSKYHVSRFNPALAKILHRQEYISYFVKKMMVLTPFILVNQKMLKIDSFSIFAIIKLIKKTIIGQQLLFS